MTAGETGGQDPRGITVGELLPRLAGGERVMVPALKPDGEGKLSPDGWAVLKDDGVAGYLEGEAALGASLLGGRAEGMTVTLNGGGVEIVSAKCWAGNGEVCCALTARAAEGQPGETALAAWGKSAIRAALDAGWDCWGLDRQLAAFHPWEWERIKGTDVRTLNVKVVGKLVSGNGR